MHNEKHLRFSNLSPGDEFIENTGVNLTGKKEINVYRKIQIAPGPNALRLHDSSLCTLDESLVVIKLRTNPPRT